jgi:hypothetical protein
MAARRDADVRGRQLDMIGTRPAPTSSGLNGPTFAGQANLPSVPDLKWQIVSADVDRNFQI